MVKANGVPKIEKGIPVPPRRLPAGGIADAMRRMVKGDSILLHSKKATAYAQSYSYIGKGKFVLRSEGKGIRVWRTA